MNQEDKELLLRDLCARLPYGVKVLDNYHKSYGVSKLINIGIDGSMLVDNEVNDIQYYPIIDNIKPYLRPMSSMTEEEIKELKALCSIYIPTDSPTIGFEDYGIVVFTHHLTNNTYSFKLNVSVIDWLNAHHFDYRGLIEKDLAIEAPEGMYN